MAGSPGMLTKLGIDTANPVTKRFDYKSCDLGVREELEDTSGLRGELSHQIERVRVVKRPVGGVLQVQPNTDEWQLLLPWMMFGSTSGSPTVTYTLGNTAATRYVTIDRIAKVYTYAGVAVDRWELRGQQNKPLDLSLDLVGQTETEANAGTFPSINIDETSGPFVFSDLVISVGGTTVTAKDLVISCNHFIDRERFFNSLSLTDVIAHDREVMCSTKVPWGDWYALYGTGHTGARVIATFTNGSQVLAFDLIKVAFPKVAPPVPGREELMLDIAGRAYQSGVGGGATKELIVQVTN